MNRTMIWHMRSKYFLSPIQKLRSLKSPVKVLLAVTALAGVVMAPLKADSQGRFTVYELLRTTRDQAILDAYKHMSGTEAELTLEKIVARPIRVFFKDLGTLIKKVKNFDALSWLSNTGQHVIFINQKHRNAPPEALAAIIAHEAIHDDPENSVQEEISGWTVEARVWSRMKAKNPSLAAIPGGQSPLVDRLNRLEAALHQGSLAQMVRTNPGYKGLPETSPGFSKQETTASATVDPSEEFSEQ